MYRLLRRLRSRHGESFAELLVSAFIAASALLMLTAAMSAFSFSEIRKSPKTETLPGTVLTEFKLDDMIFSIEIEVVYNEQGYSYPEG